MNQQQYLQDAIRFIGAGAPGASGKVAMSYVGCNIVCLGSCTDLPRMNGGDSPDGGGRGRGGLNKSCQMFGVLFKKHCTNQANSTSACTGKWAKRFFVLRDSFLLYYVDSESRSFDSRSHFNVHPKGIFPLGNATVKQMSEAGHSFAIHISSHELFSPLVIAVDSAHDRERWTNALHQASRITWTNAQMCDSMIRRLENHGLQMAEEKQNYFDKLQLEAEALNDEKLRTESLERVNEELEREKEEMQRFANELKEEHDKMKTELDDTLKELKSVEDTKRLLNNSIDKLQSTLDELQRTKMSTLTRMKTKQRPGLAQVPRQNPALARIVSGEEEDGGVEGTRGVGEGEEGKGEAADPACVNLKDIEERIRFLMENKADVEKLLKANEEKERRLEEEKKLISEHAQELDVSLKDLAAQKAITEMELREEMLARVSAEKRLLAAGETLTRLETVIQRKSFINNVEDVEQMKNEMICDVKTLKTFFEKLCAEARLQPEKSAVLRNSAHVRTTMARRAQTLKLDTLKKKRISSRRSGSAEKLDADF